MAADTPLVGESVIPGTTSLSELGDGTIMEEFSEAVSSRESGHCITAVKVADQVRNRDAISIVLDRLRTIAEAKTLEVERAVRVYRIQVS